MNAPSAEFQKSMSNRHGNWIPVFFPKAILPYSLIALTSIGQALAAAPITPSGLNTQVNLSAIQPAGKVQYDITGGTRAGSNLFHSFGDFNVPTNNIANFLNDTGAATSNILGRVTGGNPSSIFGTVQTTGFGNANLFLMNPAGIVFGPNATLNVGGSVTFTTADYLRLADGVRFNTTPNVAADSLLSAAPVAAFGFLGSNPAAIAVQGSTLQVAQGQTLSLVGGNQGFTYANPDTGIAASVPGGITMSGGNLSAQGGQINLVSVATPGEVSAADFMPTSGMTMGNISLSEGALLDVSANAAGTVRIRGGQLIIDNSTISADTINADGAPIAIDLNLTGTLSISNNSAPALTARTSGSGNAGEISVTSGSLVATSSPVPSLFALIDSQTSGAGNAGKINITTGDLTVTIDPSAPRFFIDSGTGGAGNGGDVTIKAGTASFSSSGINTGDIIAGGSGSAGNLKITSNALTLISSTFTADSLNARGGDVTLEARDIAMTMSSTIDVLSLEGESAIRINADHLKVDGLSSILNQTALGPGGGITIAAKTVELTNGSVIASQTFGDGDAGRIHITATDQVTLSDDALAGSSSQPSGLFTNSLGDPAVGTHGNSGTIQVTTPRLEITGGARIDSTTQSSGHGGDVTISASHKIIISGERTADVASALFGLGGTRASGIYTRTIGTTPDAGAGGNIALAVGQSVTISDGAALSASSTGPGNAGNIFINAGQQLDMHDSSIKTEAAQASGGNIDIRAVDRVSLVNSTISTSVLGGSGGGGNITIDPTLISLQNNSNILAQAVLGNGGNIQLIANLLLVDPTSVISASSEFGQSGTIQSPTSNLAGTVSALPSSTRQGQALQAQRCAVLSGRESSSFIIAGRDQVPTEPGGWMVSSIDALATGEGSVARGKGEGLAGSSSPSGLSSFFGSRNEINQNNETNQIDQIDQMDQSDQTNLPPVLSLRRLTPAGFLTQRFAEGEPIGCRS